MVFSAFDFRALAGGKEPMAKREVTRRLLLAHTFGIRILNAPKFIIFGPTFFF